MSLPIEIIERILMKCDGKTLLGARKVNEDWKNIVDYISLRTDIWEWCCNEDIPKNELVEYLQNYKSDDPDKWLNIYTNWSSWEDIKDIRCDIIRSPVEITRISCIAVSGEFIAIGSNDGRLRIYTIDWKLIYKARILAVRLNSLAFMESRCETTSGCMDLPYLTLVIAFHKGLHIFCFDGVNETQLVIHDVKSHSVYKNYVCYEKVGGRIYIARLNQTEGGGKELTEVWFSRVYSPSSISCMKMWEGVCTFLINNEVKIIDYESGDCSTMDIMKRRTRIKFNFPLVESSDTVILRDDVIIRLCKNEDDVKCDFIEFFLLGENDLYSKKMFTTWDNFRSYITCIYLYGNTLILGMDVGCLSAFDVNITAILTSKLQMDHPVVI
ncbi:unnamed protein product [Acanthoscelides obtectus]|uniref:F-box domain-containing protein n=1 Tax=Acanthoscelides obtectus TaxID=200917 RepID=A0A9P0K6C4_ACAOB|nr:unnamed protein product [Acanthoscelides obtectus]CAK1643751.1 hypothetical protein AOBTE_LOCUS13660 [Acanthoscelides obtectus]